MCASDHGCTGTNGRASPLDLVDLGSVIMVGDLPFRGGASNAKSDAPSALDLASESDPRLCQGSRVGFSHPSDAQN